MVAKLMKMRSRFLTRWFVCSFGLWVAAELLGSDSISLGGRFGVVVVSGLVLAMVNTIIKPLVVFLSLPAVLLSLGLFMIIINGLMVLVAAKLYGPLEVQNLGVAILAGMVIGLVNFLVSAVVEDRSKK
jgi:putative membrane protein